MTNGLRRTPPKENGDLNAKKEPVSPRSGRSSASSTPAPSGKKSSESGGEKPTTPKPPTTPTSSASGASAASAAAAAAAALKQGGLPGPPFGIPGFPGGPIGPGPGGFGLENGFPRPPFEPHAAAAAAAVLRPPFGMPPGGKPWVAYSTYQASLVFCAISICWLISCSQGLQFPCQCRGWEEASALPYRCTNGSWHSQTCTTNQCIATWGCGVCCDNVQPHQIRLHWW